MDQNVFVGYRTCHEFPVFQGAFDEIFEGNGEIFIESYSGDLSTKLASTFVGGEHNDIMFNMKFDASERLWIVGATTSQSFPVTPFAYDKEFNGPASAWGGWPGDGFIMTIDKNLSAGVVPVELSSLKAACINGAVELSWTTQSETENMGFFVYRATGSADKFVKLDQNLIPGCGNSSAGKRYQFRDEKVAAGHVYYYKIQTVAHSGETSWFGPVHIEVSGTPGRFVLEQNYPNPFNNQTTISFDLAQDSHIRLDIYTMTGERVRSLLDTFCGAGRYSVLWDGESDAGILLPSGTYIYKMVAGRSELSRMLVLVK